MSDLKARIAAGEVIAGTWVKTPHPVVAEVLDRTALDCMVLDAEHAPFDRGSLDACLAVARTVPVLVRVPSAAPHHILQALDSGAAGVVVPHVRSAAEAEAAVLATRYVAGGRGFAGTPRAAGFGTHGMARARADATRTVLIAQIEDAEAVENIDAIAAVAGIDALFVGRADLTISIGAETPDDARVVEAVERVCEAGQASGRPVGMFLARAGDVGQWRARGVTVFLLASDHDFIRAGVDALAAGIRA